MGLRPPPAPPTPPRATRPAARVHVAPPHPAPPTPHPHPSPGGGGVRNYNYYSAPPLIGGYGGFGGFGYPGMGFGYGGGVMAGPVFIGGGGGLFNILFFMASGRGVARCRGGVQRHGEGRGGTRRLPCTAGALPPRPHAHCPPLRLFQMFASIVVSAIRNIGRKDARDSDDDDDGFY